MDEVQAEGTVFRLDPDLTLHRMIESVSIPNGMGWSPDDKTMYFTDSPTRGIFTYDYDADSGAISNKRVFFQLRNDEEGVPDGCTIDTEGHLWVAVHEGSRVIRISPQGEVVSQITLPAWKVTCPAFGGPDFNELFITTAEVDAGEKTPNGSRDNGNVFRTKTRATGLRPNKFGAF
ncbi:SGL-domain-containing protein [Wilcoxina mikolae CBS 423.85]|nr:SGL-domain-containing protein [Wilcoxina mikolae CBS 423.85]